MSSKGFMKLIYDAFSRPRRRPTKLVILAKRWPHFKTLGAIMNPISSVNIETQGPGLHVTAQVLDQYGKPISPTPPVTFADSGPNSSFAVDPSNPAAGTVTAVSVGVDQLVVTCAGLSVTLPVTVTPYVPVPTTLVVTTP